MVIGSYTAGSMGPSSKVSSLKTLSLSSGKAAFLLMVIALLTAQLTLASVFISSSNQSQTPSKLRGCTPTSPSLEPLADWGPTPSWLSSKQRNKLARAVTGNRANRGIIIAHWNMGSAHLHNKMLELEQVVSDHHPHVIGISEANFKRGHNLEKTMI